MVILASACDNSWLNLIEELVMEDWWDQPNNQKFATALYALQDGSVSLQQAYFLAYWYSFYELLVVVLSAILTWVGVGIVAFALFLLHALWVAIAAPLICLRANCAVWLFMSPLCYLISMLLVPIAIHTALFTSVVFSILSIGLWRSSVGARGFGRK